MAFMYEKYDRSNVSDETDHRPAFEKESFQSFPSMKIESIEVASL